MRVLRIFSMSFLGLAAFACLAWAGFSLARGHYLTAAIACGAMIFWAAPLRLWFIMPKVVAWGTYDAEGTTVRVDRRVDVLLFIAVLFGAVSLGSAGILGAMNKLDIPLPPDIGPMFAGPFVAPALVFLVALFLTAKRGGIGSLRLTADGFRFVEAFSTIAGTWSQVTDVTSQAPADRPANSPLVMVMTDGQIKMLKESALYTRDGHAILQFVTFYWSNPDSRVELTDGRALERLRTLQLEAAAHD